MFQLLDKLRPTAVGLDQLPAWFLRIEAPVFYKPLTRLFNLSSATSTVYTSAVESSPNPPDPTGD